MTGTAIQSDMRIVVIPPKSREEIQRTTRLKVAAYCRVSTDQEEQESSYEAQISYYTEKIEKVTVESKNTITVTFKGGFEIRRELNGD